MFLPKLKSILYFVLIIIYINLLFYIRNLRTHNFNESLPLKVAPVNFTIDDFKIEEVIEKLLNESRNRMKWDLRNYNWSASGVKGIEDLLPEKGGRPFKTVIISPWRSGSSYLGYLLSSLPGVLYYYEPFQNFLKSDLHLRANGPETALLLKNLIRCEYFNMSRFDSYKAKDNSTVPGRYYYQDSKMWWYCKESEVVCDDDYFREKFCNLFPFQVVKDAHIRMAFLGDIMKDEKLNLRVVLVARDPRAVLRSRRLNDQDCEASFCMDANRICEDLVNDHAAARKLMRIYPKRIKILRFEELALNPEGTVQDLLQFLNLQLMQPALDFLATQALLGHNDGWVTTYEAFSWKSDMSLKQVDDIQDTCREAMELWGYVPVYNWSHQHSDKFLPIRKINVK